MFGLAFEDEMKIPLVDLNAQYASIRNEIDAAIRRVMASSSFILGAEVTLFEKAFAAYCGVKHAIGTSSGTTALYTALAASGIGPGDEVITTPMTFIATASEIRRVGARPVFVDIEPESLTLDVEKLDEKIVTEYDVDHDAGYPINRVTHRRLRAVLPVHLYGQMADMARLQNLTDRYRLLLIEDAAQAHGAEYRTPDGIWKRAGSFGVLACFSFYPSKNLGAYGDAGAVVTNDDGLADYMRRYVHHGRSAKYRHQFEGGNYRLDALQAAILRVKLGHLDQWTAARRRIARLYDQLLGDIPEITIPKVIEGRRHAYHLYVIRTPRRDELLAKLQERGIQVGIHYPLPLHLQPAYEGLNYREGDFPVAEACARQALSLPIYPEMTDEQVEYVVDTIKDALSSPREHDATL